MNLRSFKESNHELLSVPLRGDGTVCREQGAVFIERDSNPCLPAGAGCCNHLSYQSLTLRLTPLATHRKSSRRSGRDTPEQVYKRSCCWCVSVRQTVLDETKRTPVWPASTRRVCALSPRPYRVSLLYALLGSRRARILTSGNELRALLSAPVMVLS